MSLNESSQDARLVQVTSLSESGVEVVSIHGSSLLKHSPQSVLEGVVAAGHRKSRKEDFTNHRDCLIVVVALAIHIGV